MKKFLKKEERGIIAQLCSLEVPSSKSSISLDLQNVLDNHLKVFETPKGLPPIHDHDHAIHLILGSVLPNTTCLIDIHMPKRMKLNVWL